MEEVGIESSANAVSTLQAAATGPVIAKVNKAAASKKAKKGKTGFRKAPQAPRRFKSPYILFSISKMAEYKQVSANVQVTSISRHIAEEWKLLPAEDRKKWDEVALQDKLRYNAEKRLYTGPWQVPSKRSRKVRISSYVIVTISVAHHIRPVVQGKLTELVPSHDQYRTLVLLNDQRRPFCSFARRRGRS
jgi:hypothetical protein